MPTPDMSQVKYEPLQTSSGRGSKSAELPKQGIKPWVMYQNYIADIFLTRFSALQTAL